MTEDAVTIAAAARDRAASVVTAGAGSGGDAVVGVRTLSAAGASPPSAAASADLLANAALDATAASRAFPAAAASFEWL